MNNYFVTGATGAIGSTLVPLLLADPDTQVHLLLRAKSAEDLSRRVEELCAFWEIESSDPRRPRIRASIGDVTLPRLGLDENAYADVAAGCTHLVHSAGNVRMNLPIDQARRSSVDSARNIIELARACKNLKKVEFVSTVGVGGRTLKMVPEEWISIPREFHNTYEQAKAEAETLIQPDVLSGLPLTVHRPSMVVGNAGDGKIIHFQIFYHLCEFLSGSRTFGLTPQFGSARLDIVPADYVAKAILWSSRTAETSGRVMHLCAGPEHAMLLGPLQDFVRQAFSGAGRSVPGRIVLATSVFKGILSFASLFMDEQNRRAVKTLPVFLDYMATEQRFSNDLTREILARAGMPLPVPTTYLGQVLAYYLARRR